MGKMEMLQKINAREDIKVIFDMAMAELTEQDLEEVLAGNYHFVSTVWMLRAKALNKRVNEVKLIDIPNRETLSKLFMEPVSEDDMKYIDYCMNFNGWTFDKVLKAHNQDKTRRILSIVQGVCRVA